MASLLASTSAATGAVAAPQASNAAVSRGSSSLAMAPFRASSLSGQKLQVACSAARVGIAGAETAEAPVGFTPPELKPGTRDEYGSFASPRCALKACKLRSRVRGTQRSGKRAQRTCIVTNVATAEPQAPPAEKASKENARPVFPFTAIVGQEEMKLCLILNVIDPKIGGVMIMGDRGTGKSTTVRALVDLLPEIQVVSGDPFNSDPEDPELMSEDVRKRIQAGEGFSVLSTKINMVDLPLGATEDRVCGTIDIEKALTEGVKAFEPGLLAKANRGILYVDEVNLLDDHLVDVLLDSAASGWNTVEREGISISHPARFILIGSGNPEEGELRPQLLDRFGMHAQVTTVKDAELRVKIVEERGSFDQDSASFRTGYEESQQNLRQQIFDARARLSKITVAHDLRVKISRVCSELDVDGLRGDIVTTRAAKALAALRQRDEVTPKDILTVIPNCLRHRLRKDPLESIDSGLLVVEKFSEVFGFSSKVAG